MKLTFLGAAGEVTGSQHLIETRTLRILLDCGLFQGHRGETRAKNERFRCRPKDVDAVFLSHAHIDHCGNLPGLYRAGFRGPIFCTPATADVADVMLRDSVHIQNEDARYLTNRLQAGHPPIEPLYDDEDVKAVVGLFETLEYGEWHELSRECRLRFSDAGHILGSAIMEIQIDDSGEWKRIAFSGDLGRRGLPLLRDPQRIPGCDVLLCESTYGNRIHPAPDDIKGRLLQILTNAVQQKGKVIIPAFSLGRTQSLVYFLNGLTDAGLLPEIPVYVDSPLSNRLTSIYRRHYGIMNSQVQHVLERDEDPFGFRGLTYIRTQEESARLNHQSGPFVVISASGMCESGRVRHHLLHAVDDPRNTIVIIGYQARHTLGRRIVERQPYLKIFDREYPLRATVEVVNGLSAHADADDFKWWFERLASEGGVGRAFLVHGEPESSQALATLIRDYCDEDPVIPELYQEFEV